jgi:phenylacetate-coenzyme A ligase PaaK-like adenylate-forming protein
MFQTLAYALRTLALNQVPRRPPEEVERLQEQRLRRLVRWAVARSPFFREKYRGVRLDRFRLADLPPVGKAELMDRFDEAVTDPHVRQSDVVEFFEDPGNLGRYFRGRYAVCHTSGSQGRPMSIVQDRAVLDLLFGLHFTRGNATARVGAREALRRLLNPARLAVVTTRPGFFPSAAAFAYMPAPAKRFVRKAQFSSTDPQIVERLVEFRPTVLTSYASVLETLAQDADRLRLAPDLRQVVNISEMLTEKARARVEAAFGVPVVDCYSMGECPFLSNGCPAGSGAHVNADWAVFEVVDEAYRPVPPGTLGHKVLVTNLANRVQPIIRYEIGDVVEMADRPCRCGSRLPRIARVVGRAAEKLWVRDGTRGCEVSGSLLKNACDYFHQAREWQVVQTEHDQLRVRLELLPGAALDRARAERAVADRLAFFGLPRGVEVRLEIVPRLEPDPATGKFRRLVSLGGAAGAAREPVRQAG